VIGVAGAAASYAAGVLSTLSPCVLPLLPVLLLSSLQQDRRGPLALAAGLAVSFTVLGLVLASFGFAIGLDSHVIRVAVAVAMMAVGAVLLTPALQDAFARAVAPLTAHGNNILARFTPNGLGGQFMLGVLLGAVWSPCTGPTLGAAVGLAANTGTMAQAAFVMAIFSLGAATPVLVLGYGGAQAMRGRRATWGRAAAVGKPLMGAALLLVGGFIVTGADRVVEIWLTDAMPAWLVELTTRI